MSTIWNGYATAGTQAITSERRHELADAARDYEWQQMLVLLRETPELVNGTRPGGSAYYAPLHQAAHGGAPLEVVQELIGLGAWRTLPTADGERAVDIAGRLGRQQLMSVLLPVLRRAVSPLALGNMQQHFQAVIRERAADLVDEQRLRLPELGPLMEIEEPKMWFPVPGMYGGFSYWLEGAGKEVRLISESWSRVVGGSGQRHEITAMGSRLVDEGFV